MRSRISRRTADPSVATSSAPGRAFEGTPAEPTPILLHSFDRLGPPAAIDGPTASSLQLRASPSVPGSPAPASETVQRVITSGGQNLGMLVDGAQLFMNTHLSQYDPENDASYFNTHTTTQVSLDRAYQGDARTYNDGGERFGFREVGLGDLTSDQLSWVWDTHDTYTVAIWGESARHG